MPVVRCRIVVEVLGWAQEGGATCFGRPPDAAGISIVDVEEGEVGEGKGDGGVKASAISHVLHLMRWGAMSKPEASCPCIY